MSTGMMKPDNQELSPMQLLEQQAHRVTAEAEAAEIVSDARTRLVAGSGTGQVFLARLTLDLTPEPNWDIKTTATDGYSLFYNPDYITRLETSQLIGVVCQNSLHCALKHITRKGTKNQDQWDIAADLSVDNDILDSGIKLPSDAPVAGEGKYSEFERGLSAEEYYDLLHDENDDDNQDGDGDGDGDGAGCSVSLDSAGDASEKSDLEGKWDQNVASAEHSAKQRGELSEGFARMCNTILEPKVDWREQLRDFVNERARNDFTWSSPNRRFAWQGIILPGLQSEEVGRLAIAIDTSGSISDAELTRFLSETQGILEAFDCELTIIYHHHDAYRLQKWKSTDGPLELEQTESGGTSHVPVFDKIEEDELPTALICFTDAYSAFPEFPPEYPVMWAIIQNENPSIPWGEVIMVND